MKPVNCVIFKFVLSAVSLLVLGSFAGCGSGGGSAIIESNASSVPVGDKIANVNAGNGAKISAGCTNSTFVPNFAGAVPLYRWTHEPIRVRFLNSGVVQMNDGGQSDLQQIALAGFQEWAAATNNGVTIQLTNDPAQTDVTVHFGHLAAVPTANDVLGLESSTLFADGTIKTADVLLNEWPTMTAGNIDSFRETAAHEFGHALGIAGHSASSLDVMYAAHVLSNGKNLTARDVNTLLTAYCNQFTREAPSQPTGPERIVSIQ